MSLNSKGEHEYWLYRASVDKRRWRDVVGSGEDVETSSKHDSYSRSLTNLDLAALHKLAEKTALVQDTSQQTLEKLYRGAESFAADNFGFRYPDQCDFLIAEDRSALFSAFIPQVEETNS